MEHKWKRGFGKVSKWTVLKFTGLALTVAFAVNINNTTNQIQKRQVVQGEVIAAALDSATVARVAGLLEVAETGAERDSLLARLAARVDSLAAERASQQRDSTVVRYLTVPRDSLTIRTVVVTRDSLVRRVVWDTLKTEPPAPTAWQLYRGGPIID